MARRQLKPLDALDLIEKEAEAQLARLEAAEDIGLLAKRDWCAYICEVDPEEARYTFDLDGDYH
jgi:hypothetical protein